MLAYNLVHKSCAAACCSAVTFDRGGARKGSNSKVTQKHLCTNLPTPLQSTHVFSHFLFLVLAAGLSADCPQRAPCAEIALSVCTGYSQLWRCDRTMVPQLALATHTHNSPQLFHTSGLRIVILMSQKCTSHLKIATLAAAALQAWANKHQAYSYRTQGANIMWDRRVFRGNTYASQVMPPVRDCGIWLCACLPLAKVCAHTVFIAVSPGRGGADHSRNGIHK